MNLEQRIDDLRAKGYITIPEYKEIIDKAPVQIIRLLKPSGILTKLTFDLLYKEQ